LSYCFHKTPLLWNTLKYNQFSRLLTRLDEAFWLAAIVSIV